MDKRRCSPSGDEGAANVAGVARCRWAKLRNAHEFGCRLHRSSHVASTMHPESSNHLEDLVPHRERSISAIARRASRRTLVPGDDDHSKEHGSFLSAALTSVGLGVFSVVPYNVLLQGDPGSPLFISFALHVAVVAAYIPRAVQILRNRKFPILYHAGIVAFMCLFTSLKSDAYVRLPASVCMLLSNLRMLVGVAVQYALFRKVYSRPQLVGVAVVTAGIAWAGHSMQQQQAASKSAVTSASGGGDVNAALLVGVLEILGASVSLALVNVLIKQANFKYGESLEEQIFLQHLCVIPVVFPTQWDRVGPRCSSWVQNGDYWLLFNLALSVASTFGARRAAAAMAGRSPNLLMTQLVQTMECFMQLLVTAMFRVPPLPPSGFWLGSAMLVGGTVHYLSCSDVPGGSCPEDVRGDASSGDPKKTS